MNDTPLTQEQKKEEIRKQIQKICKEQDLTELEVVRILKFNLPIYLKRKEKKPKD